MSGNGVLKGSFTIGTGLTIGVLMVLLVTFALTHMGVTGSFVDSMATKLKP